VSEAVVREAAARLEKVVVLCTDARFVLPCAFLIDQLAGDPHGDRYDVVLVHDEVPETDLRRLLDRAQRPILPVAFEAAAARLSGVATDERLSRATYIRLYLDALLPQAYRRILYLDSDIALERPEVARLLDADLGGMPFAAARDGVDIGLLGPDIELDVPHTWKSHREMRGYKEGLGLGPFDPYVNAGVLLIDRQRWVEEALSERVLAFATAHPDRCRFADQSALNAVKGDRWAELSPRWNFQPVHAAAGLRRAIDPWLIHFAGAYKPWNTEVWGKRFTRDYRDWQARTGWPGTFPPGPSLTMDMLSGRKRGPLERLKHRLFKSTRPPEDPLGPERRAGVREAVLKAMVGRRFIDLDVAGQAALAEAVANAA
jgi:lipopolysaccharide biosynthesis glycosyltransferase